MNEESNIYVLVVNTLTCLLIIANLIFYIVTHKR